MVKEIIGVLKDHKKNNRDEYKSRCTNWLSTFPSPIQSYPGPIQKLLWYCLRNTPTVDILENPNINVHWRNKLKLWKFRQYKKARRASNFLGLRKYRPKFQRSRRYNRFRRNYRRSYRKTYRKRYYRRRR